MLTASQYGEYEELGLARLPTTVDPDAVRDVRDRIWALLDERMGIRSDDPATWKRVNAKATKPLQKKGVFGVMASAQVRGALDGLIGEGGWHEPSNWGQLLMTFPVKGVWMVPHKAWHFDFRAQAAAKLPPGVQVFLLVDRVVPEGGGTLVVTGSHRFVKRIRESAPTHWQGRSAELRRALRREVPWMRALTSTAHDADRAERFMAETESYEGVPLRVVELFGEPGDVYLMHPWMLHAPSLNCAEHPRMMLTERIHRLPG